MRFSQVGICSYGVSLPRRCIHSDMIESAQGKVGHGVGRSLGVAQKTVPAIDEDAATLAVQAGIQAVHRGMLDPESISALFVGSESHPYAVKPTGTIVHEALGLSSQISLADLQFACKAGTQGIQIVSAYVEARLCQFGMAIGADTAQARPGDVLEYTAGAGACAVVLGSKRLLARVLASVSVATDTPDFWRRPGQSYPEHAGRFSGDPGYFSHVTRATQALLREVSLTPKEIDHCVFHTPNGKFPRQIAKTLGFSQEQLADSLVVDQIGNTYAGASLIALSALLDVVGSEKRILLCSYGSGAGADAFLLETTSLLVEQRKGWGDFVRDQIKQLHPVSYEEYRRASSH